MNALEKSLGAVTAAAVVIGTILTLLGNLEAGIIAAGLVALFGLFSMAQLLRDSRRQNRSLELLREAEKKSRSAIAEVRIDGVHARNDIVGQSRRIRAELKDQFGRSSRRDAALRAAVGAETAAVRSAIAARVAKEAGVTRESLRDLATQTAGRLAQAEELLLAQIEARARQVRQQLVTERTAIIKEMAKSEGRVNDALVEGIDTTTCYQQVTAQKLVAQQDGLRRVVDLARLGLRDLGRSVSEIDGRIEALTSSVDGVAAREELEAVAGTIALHRDESTRLAAQVASLMKELDHALSNVATANSLSELSTSVTELGIAAVDKMDGAQARLDLLTGNARVLSEQIVEIEEKVTGLELQRGRVLTPSMVDIDERIDALRHKDDSAITVQSTDIDVTVAAHRATLGRLREVLHEVRTSEDLPGGERKKMLGSLYSELGMQDVAQEDVLDVGDYGVGVSFRAQMVRLMHLKESLASRGYVISPRENDKMRDRKFAEALGIPTPSLLFHDVPTVDVEVNPNSIIKPVKGESSRGVFFVRSDARLVSLKTRNVYLTFEEAAAEYSTWSGADADPRWIGEAAVLDQEGNPARDIKAFMFYGEVGLYREILRNAGRGPGPVTAAYDAQGRRIAYRGNDDPVRDAAIPAEVAEMAERISLSSPVPFLRVDFLVGSGGPVLGEITPHPGGIYAGGASDKVDRAMGKMFLEADARLTIDHLRGKQFRDYLRAYKVGPQE